MFTFSTAIGANGILIFPRQLDEQFLIFISHFEWIEVKVRFLLNKQHLYSNRVYKLQVKNIELARAYNQRECALIDSVWFRPA